MNHDEKFTYLQQKLGEEVRREVPLRDYTTMRVGGVADFFYEAKTAETLVAIVRLAFMLDIPYLVIGSGSNIIFSDAGFPGLVVHNLASNIACITDKSQMIADSGAVFARVITEAAAHDLGGAEYWFGLPGTIGGAVHNNAETWGHDMSEIVRYVTLLFPPSGGEPSRIERVPVEWMDYSYRSSKLKHWTGPDKPIILTVTLQLQLQRKEEIMRRMREHKQGRWDLNQPKGVASAGSYFKNPGGPSHAPGGRPPEASAGWLLEQVGAKQVKVGQAVPSRQHANFITNLGNASANDVRGLAQELKQRVKDTFNIDLEEEVQYLGVWPESHEK